MSKRRGLKEPLLRVLKYFRPYLGRLGAILVVTVIASACEGGQALLLEPLLDRVLLKSADSTDDGADLETRDALLAKSKVQNPAQLIAAEARFLPPASASPSAEELKPFTGRTRPTEWDDAPICQLLDHTRKVLVAIERGLADVEAPQEARDALADATRRQRHAERLLADDPLVASTQTKWLAAHFSYEARTLAREGNFKSAWEDLRWIMIAAFVLGIGLGASRFLKSLLARLIVILITRDIEVLLVRRVLSLSVGQLGDRTRGDLLARLNVDLYVMIGGVVSPMSMKLIFEPARLVMYLAAALWLSPPLCAILVVLGISVLVPIRFAGKKIRRSARVRMTALGEVLEAMHQMFSGIRIVKAFQREALERDRLRARTDKAYSAQIKTVLARQLSRSWLRLINNTSLPLVIVAGGYLVVHHMWGLTAGTFAAFSGLIVLMYRPVRSLASAYNVLQNSLPSMNRVFEILDQVPAVVDAEDAVPLEAFADSIDVNDVSFTYDGQRDVLRNVSFVAKAGTTTAIVGHTGSGKSTLMDLLSRTMDPSKGQICLDGVGLEKLTLDSFRGKLAVVSQSTFVFNDTLRENIRYGRLEATDAEVEDAARAARVHDEIMAFPDGYEHTAGEMGARLSGGQLQRLTIARAMIRRPEILLLDEAMSALDTQTEHLVQEAIAELGKACTTFVIAHRLSTVRHADQILVMHDGELVERGTHDELAKIPDGHYAALLTQLST